MTSESSAAHELIEQGQGLVRSLATRVHRSIPVRADLDDLIAYGELGLAQAARDYDPSHGVAFTTFAFLRVRGAIYDGVAEMTWTSRAQYRRLRFKQMAGEALAADDPQAAGGESLEADTKWFRAVTDRLATVFVAIHSGEDGGIRDSAIVDPRATAPAIVAQREIGQRLRDLIEELPDFEKRLIKMVYLEGATLHHAAKMLGISKSWASRLHAKTLESLARSLRKLGASE